MTNVWFSITDPIWEHFIDKGHTMGKRKGAAPKKTDETKRQQLSWDMKDLRSTVSIEDSDDDAGPFHVTDAAVAKRLLKDIQSSSGVVERSDSGYASTSSLTAETPADLQALIDDTDYCFSVFRSLNVKDNAWSCVLGTFFLHLKSAPQHLPEVNEFWLYANSDLAKQLVYYEVENCQNGDKSPKLDVSYFEAETTFPFCCLESLQLKCIRLVYSGYTPGDGTLELKVCGLEGILTTLNFSSEGSRPRKTDKAVASLMSNFYGIESPGR